MGIADGSVSGLTKVHDSGLPADRLNLVLASDGYTAAQMSDFQTHVDEFIAHFFSTAPFDEEAIACALNIYRLDVVSNESGADEPDCNGPGAGTTAATYFDSTYCADDSTDRLLYGDASIVEDTLDIWIPEWTQVVVLVNGSKRGGGGGSMAFLSTSSSDWKDVAIHEMGHSVFDLADEYDNDQPEDTYTDGEPLRVNVTVEPDPTLVKWNSLVTVGPTSPTSPNTDCTTGNGGSGPVTASDVGTFEGASRFNCGIYRPRANCKMRSSTHASFCPVCEAQVRSVMSAYASPSTTGDITLETATLSFDDIPEGTSAVRPVTWLVDTCLPVTFQVVNDPSNPFTIAFDPLVVSTPVAGTSVRQARLWIRYDAGTAGTSHADSVEVEILETGVRDTIELSGNAVTRPTAAVQLVLDKSGSMRDLTSEGRTKEEVLRDSARILADVAYPDTGIGITTFDQNAQDVLEIVDAGPIEGGGGRDDVADAIEDYEATPFGKTASGDGIERAKIKLDDATTYNDHSMIVLTDGKDTASKGVDEVADGIINQRVFAIGLGTAEQINPETLSTLAGATGGYTLMTGLLTTDDQFTLEKYYLQILAGATNQDIILDPEGTLSLGGNSRVRIPFDVADTDIEITGIILSTLPSALFVGLESPDGTRFNSSDTGPDFSVTMSRRSHVLRASLPLVDTSSGMGYRDGRWHLLLQLNEKEVLKQIEQEGQIDDREPQREITRRAEALRRLREQGLRYSAVVQTYSNLKMQVELAQSDNQPGAILYMKARLTEYGAPLQGSANVRVHVTGPDASSELISMSHQGDGMFLAESNLDITGLYQLRFVANGRTYRERPFTREELRSAAVWQATSGGSDNPGGGSGSGNGDSDLSDILCCLLRNGGLDDRFYKRMSDWGIEPEVLKKCLERQCKESDG